MSLTFSDNGRPADVAGALGRAALGLPIRVDGTESAVRAFVAQVQAAKDAAVPGYDETAASLKAVGMVSLALNPGEARELRECIDADVMDLSTGALDDEDAAKVAVLHTVLARLDALLAGVA